MVVFYWTSYITLCVNLSTNC